MAVLFFLINAAYLSLNCVKAQCMKLTESKPDFSAKFSLCMSGFWFFVARHVLSG